MHFFVGEGRQAFEIEPPCRDRLREVANVAGLLTAETDREQGRVAEIEESIGCQRTHRGAEPIECRLRRSQRDLLLEHDVGKRREPGRPIPHRWRTEASDDAAQVGVTGGELIHGQDERFLGQRGRRGCHARTIAPRP